MSRKSSGNRRRRGPVDNKDTNPSPKRRRRRLPKAVELAWGQDLEQNDCHPLAGMEASRRKADREHLIGTILARLADQQSRASRDFDRIGESSASKERNGVSHAKTKQK